MGLGPTQGDEKRLLCGHHFSGSTVLPFVISTGAQRSAEICGSGPLLEMFFDRAYPDFLLRSVSDVHADPQSHGSLHEIWGSVPEGPSVSFPRTHTLSSAPRCSWRSAVSHNGPKQCQLVPQVSK
jgi:hypothetical protein